MEDLLYRGRLEAFDIAVSYAVTTELVNGVVLRHNCDPCAAHLMGRAVTAGVLCAAQLNPRERLNICWKYEGQARTILVDVGADGTARGLISPTNLSDFASDKNAIFGDKAELSVIRSQEGRVTASSTSDSILQDVVNDLAYFCCVSDQVETGMTVLIGFNPDDENPVNLCQGIQMQALPGCDLERFDRIRETLGHESTRNLLGEKNETDSHFENIINALLAEETDSPGLRYDACPKPTFRCTCSKDKLATVVRALPYNERMEMVKEKKNVKISCQFCNKQYEITIEDCIQAWNDRPTS
jgi:molecular chaperone Hsp33